MDAVAATRPRFVHIESLRGLAVLAVLAFHVSVLTDHIGRGVTGRLSAPLGTLGVSVFFVLSGFLLYRPLIAARRSGLPTRPVGEYFKRRARRILPSYWVALTVLAIFPGIVGVFTADFWRYYGLLQIYSEETVGGGLSVAWTLCVEAAFYLLLPVWALCAARARSERADVAAIVVVAVASGAVQLAVMQHSIGRLVGVSLAGQAIWFALGMLLAHASVSETRVVERTGTHGALLWTGAGACLAGLAALSDGAGYAAWLNAQSLPVPTVESVLRIVLTAGFCALAVAPALFATARRDVPRRVFGWGPVRELGVVSYGLFLYHLTVAQWLLWDDAPEQFRASGLGLENMLGDGATAILFVLTLAVTLPLAWLNHRLVERRF